MAVTMHDDLLFINYFPYFLSQHGVWDVYGFFGNHFIRQVGYTYYPPGVYYLTAIGQWLFQNLNSNFVLVIERYHHFYYNALPIAEADLFSGLSILQMMGLAFWTKAPYLILEAGIAALIAQTFCSSREAVDKALRLWFMSPIVIFSVYVMGQHRLYTTFFIWGALWAMRRGKTKFVWLSMAGACLCDSISWVLIPPALIVFGREKYQRLQFLFWGVIPIALALIPLAFSSSGFVTTAYYAPLLQKQTMQGIFRHSIPGMPQALKILLAASYIFILALLEKKEHSLSRQDEDATLDFATACLAILFTLYATTSTVIHYFMWAMPFAVLVALDKPDKNSIYFGAIIALLFIFNLDSRRLNLGLLTPLGPSFWMAQPSWHEWVQAWLPWWGSLIATARLGFSVLCLWKAWHLVRNRFVSVNS